VTAFDLNYPSAHIAGMNVRAILADIKKVKGWNQTQIAKQLQVDQSTVSKWTTGKQKPEIDQRDRIMGLARKLRLVPQSASADDFSVPIVGYVGAGGEVLFSEGQGPFGHVQMPPKNAGETTVAVVVRGDSMSGQLEDGWTIYYDKRQEPPSESLTGRLCVVGLTDGRVLVKKLIHGRQVGHYDLYSANAAPLLDQPVQWAAKVSWIAPA